MFHRLPSELEQQLTPEEFTELIAYQSVKGDAIERERERAKVKAHAATATTTAKKGKMGSQRKGTA